MTEKPIFRFFINNYVWVFTLLIAIEISLFTFWRRELGIFLGPIALLVLGILIAGYPVWRKWQEKKDASASFPVIQEKKWEKGMSWAIFLISILVLIPLYAQILQEYPIIVEKSDIYPTIKLCVDRFLAGQPVYASDYSFGYHHYPNYLPGKWMPFVIAEWAGFDYRWISFLIFSMGFFLYFQNLNRHAFQFPIKLLLSLTPGLTLLYYHLHLPGQLAYTVEIMDLGIHIFLFVAVLHGGIVSRSMSIIWVLLSRYSLIFWLPVYFLALFLKEDKRNTLITAGVIMAGICLLYIFPFLSQDWNSFFLGHESYLAAAKGSWSVNLRADQIVPHVMEDQVGIASYFYLYLPGDVLTRIGYLRMVHLIVSLSIAIALGGIYMKVHDKISPKYFFLFGLKAYLMFFYVFLQVPFLYLFITPVFLSLILLQEMTMGTEKTELEMG